MSDRRRNLVAGFICVLFYCCGATIMAASPPERIGFQGVLKDGNGVPVVGTQPVAFVLYDTDAGCPGGGTLLLTDDQGSVMFNSGLFNVSLGTGTLTAGTASSLAEVFRDNPDVWIEIGVNGETLCPRIRVDSAGYALNSDHLDGKTADDFLDTSATAQVKAGDLSVLGSLAAGEIEATSAGVKFPDGTTQTTSASKPANVAVVATAGGDYTGPAAALSDSSTWCPSPSTTTPCLLRIMPGTYTLSSTLDTVPHIHFRGSGSAETVLSLQNSNTSPAIRANGDTTLSDFALHRSSTSSGALTLHVIGSNTVIEDLHIELLSTATGIATDGPGGTVIRQVTIRAELPGVTSGLITGIQKRNHPLLVEDVNIDLVGGGNQAALTIGQVMVSSTDVLTVVDTTVRMRGFQFQSFGIDGLKGVTLRNSSIDISAPSANSAAIRAFEDLHVTNSKLTVDGDANSRGIWFVFDPDDIDAQIRNSIVVGPTSILQQNTGANPVFVGGTQLGGPSDTTVGSMVCAAVYDETYSFFPGTCP